MSFKAILYDIQNDIARIELNRPDLMNGLNSDMRVDILKAIHHAEKNARVIVLTGNGKAFCSGQDLGDAKSVAELNVEAVLLEEYEPMLKAIYECSIPTIAAVNGPAVGAGANLALACDIVVACESAYFIQAFTRIGLIPDAGGTYWLPRQIGFARAMGATLLADKIPALQAVEWGMIYEVAPDEEFQARIDEIALKLVKGPTKAYHLLKQAMRASLDNTLEQQLRLEAELQGEAGKTRDFTEGVMAFLEKRPPQFEGR